MMKNLDENFNLQKKNKKKKKKLSNLIQTLTFFDKVSGINMIKFQSNQTSFKKIKFCLDHDCRKLV